MSYHINWISRIQDTDDEAFDMHIPPDIIFKIVENGSTYEIKAHKMVMGMASPVFNRMFFVADTKDKDAKELLVKETTAKAFQIMTEALYNKKLIKDNLSGKSVQEVFAVLDLVTRYKISELLSSVKEYLSNFPLTEETVLEVAKDAMHYAATFGDEANALLIACAKYLKPKFTDSQSVFQYASDNEDHGDVIFRLLVLLKNIVPSKCPNCQQEVCMDGKGIDVNQFRVGLVVTNDREGQTGYWGSSLWGTGRVDRLDGDCVRVESIKAGAHRKFETSFPIFKIQNEKPTFLFSCK